MDSRTVRNILIYLAICAALPFLIGAVVQLDQPYKRIASGQQYVASGATKIPDTATAGAYEVFAQVTGGALRYWLSGATPHGNGQEGFKLADNDYLVLDTPDKISGFIWRPDATATGVTVTWRTSGKS